jgi:hypothetical protein
MLRTGFKRVPEAKDNKDVNPLSNILLTIPAGELHPAQKISYRNWRLTVRTLGTDFMRVAVLESKRRISV